MIRRRRQAARSVSSSSSKHTRHERTAFCLRRRCLSKKPRRVRAHRREFSPIRFLRRHVRRRKHFSVCKCANCPPAADSECAQQAAALSKKWLCHFFDTMSDGAGILPAPSFFVFSEHVYQMSTKKTLKTLSPKRRRRLSIPHVYQMSTIGTFEPKKPTFFVLTHYFPYKIRSARRVILGW